MTEKNIENITKSIKKIFDDQLYNITNTTDTNINNKYPITFEIKTIENATCLILEFNEDYIYIDTLNRCGNNSGTYLLKKIDDLAALIPNIKYIGLKDGSTIYNDNINLQFLKILAKGKSWYNSLGYISDNYENEKAHNEELRNTTLIQLLEKCKDKLIQIFIKYRGKETLLDDIKRYKELSERSAYSKTMLQQTEQNYNNYDNYVSTEIKKIENKIETLKNDIENTYPSIDIMTIKTKDFFKYINSSIKLSNEEIILFEKLINVVAHIILYDINLKKYVDRDNVVLTKKGGKKKITRKIKKPCKNKKTLTKTQRKCIIHGRLK